MQATASNDFTVKLWNIKTGEETACCKGHMAAVTDVSYKVIFSFNVTSLFLLDVDVI